MILRARLLLTMCGPPLQDGAVAIAGERIVDVGTFAEVRARQAGEVRDLGEVILLPGLINAHCHLDYTALRGRIPATESFAEWVRAINQCKAAWSEDDYVRSITEGCAEAARFGTTTMVNFAAVPSVIGRLPELPMRIWWCAEMIDVREAVSPRELLANLRAMRPAADGVGLAPHAPYTASAKLYRETAEVVRGENLLATTHLAESREEMETFREGGGRLFALLAAIGRPMDDCGSATPLALLLQREVLDERWIVAHLNEIAEEDFALLGGAARFHVVHCPRSHRFFAHREFPWARLEALGFNVCLGTDSLASNQDLNLFAEMRELRRRAPQLSARTLLEMVTVRAARALRQENELGQIAPGYRADFVSLPFAGAAGDSFERVLEFAGEVPWRMLRGEVSLPS